MIENKLACDELLYYIGSWGNSVGKLEMLGVARRMDFNVARGRMPFFTQPYPLNLLETFFSFSAGCCLTLVKVRKIPSPCHSR